MVLDQRQIIERGNHEDLINQKGIYYRKTDKNIINNKLIISISREHGTGGKEIARRVVEKLELKFFDNVNY